MAECPDIEGRSNCRLNGEQRQLVEELECTSEI
jgi:hypothetical protein